MASKRISLERMLEEIMDCGYWFTLTPTYISLSTPGGDEVFFDANEGDRLEDVVFRALLWATGSQNNCQKEDDF